MITRDYAATPARRPQATMHHVTTRETPHATYTLRKGVVIGKHRTLKQRARLLRDWFSRRREPLLVTIVPGVELNDTPLEFGSNVSMFLRRQAD